MTDHTALIERLESAEAGSAFARGDAIALCKALGLYHRSVAIRGRAWRALNGSLDAALALAERVLDQHEPININICLAGSAQAQIYPVDLCGPHDEAVAPTPALALCIAILRALQSKEQADE